MSDEKHIIPKEISTEDFDVIFASKAEDGTILATSSESWSSRQLSMALSAYDPENRKYSAYLNEGVSPSSFLSIDEIDDLATNTQNDLTKVMKINAYNRKLINKNEADLTEKPNISILEITEKRSRSAENNRPRNRTKV